jgi:hypothetical protein
MTSGPAGRTTCGRADEAAAGGDDSHFGEKPSILKGWRRGGKATPEKAFGL